MVKVLNGPQTDPTSHLSVPGLQTHCFILGGGVQSLSCVQLIVTPWTAARQASLSFTISRGLPKFMSIESVMPSNHLIFCLILCCPNTPKANVPPPQALALQLPLSLSPPPRDPLACHSPFTLFGCHRFGKISPDTYPKQQSSHHSPSLPFSLSPMMYLSQLFAFSLPTGRHPPQKVGICFLFCSTPGV